MDKSDYAVFWNANLPADGDAPDLPGAHQFVSVITSDIQHLRNLPDGQDVRV